jgi:adenylate kinase
MIHQVVILIGPPGAGKGTQADLLADDFGFSHLESSKILEEKIQKGNPSDPVVAQAQANYHAGKLIDGSVVAQWVSEKLQKIGATQSMVLSGSFRTVAEAEIAAPHMEKLFGKENIHVMNINVGEAESVARNVSRRICRANRHPIPNFPEFQNLTACPKDGSELIKRTLDTEDTMKVRYATYLRETTPVLDYFRQRGYTVMEVDGEKSIRDVHNELVSKLHAIEHPDLTQKLNDSISATN